MTERKRAERAEAFVAPTEQGAPSVEEKRKRKFQGDEVARDPTKGAEKAKKKKKRKEMEAIRSGKSRCTISS